MKREELYALLESADLQVSRIRSTLPRVPLKLEELDPAKLFRRRNDGCTIIKNRGCTVNEGCSKSVATDFGPRL